MASLAVLTRRLTPAVPPRPAQTLALSVRVLDYLSSCVADGQDAIETNRGTLEDERVDGGAQRSRLV